MELWVFPNQLVCCFVFWLCCIAVIKICRQHQKAHRYSCQWDPQYWLIIIFFDVRECISVEALQTQRTNLRVLIKCLLHLAAAVCVWQSEMMQLLGLFSCAMVLLNEASSLPFSRRKTKQNMHSFIATVDSVCLWDTWSLGHVWGRKPLVFGKTVVNASKGGPGSIP